MFRQLNLRSWFTFLSRNRLYTAVNFIGLALALAFVLLVADYTVRQFTVDNYQTKADRIYAVCSEESVTSGYYLQKHLRDRYPEIESSCSVAFFEDSDAGTTPVEIGRQKFLASVLYADTTFFRMFDFTLLEGSREEALAAREEAVIHGFLESSLHGNGVEAVLKIRLHLRAAFGEDRLDLLGIVRSAHEWVLYVVFSGGKSS